MLNVLELPPMWYGAGDAGWVPPFDVEEMRDEARKDWKDTWSAEFDGMRVRRTLAEGDARKADRVSCQGPSSRSDHDADTRLWPVSEHAARDR